MGFFLVDKGEWSGRKWTSMPSWSFSLAIHVKKVARNGCSVMSDSVTPWTVAHPAPLSIGFPRQEYWSGLPFPSPGDLPGPGIKPTSPAWADRFLTTEPLGSPAQGLAQSKISTLVCPLLFSGDARKSWRRASCLSVCLHMVSLRDWLGLPPSMTVSGVRPR